MNILQKEDLAAASFANTNTNATGGVAIRTDAGSTVGAAITAATPAAQTLSIAGQTLSLSGGGGSVAVPSTVFATPAETIAGVDTGKAVDPADLTAKLANQPAAGACTDREDVVWNGTILQGAAKHYEFSGKFGITSDFAPGAGYVWPTGDTGKLSAAPLSITNPSSCRTMRVHINELSNRFESIAFTTTGSSSSQVAVVSVGGVEIAENLGTAIYSSTSEVTNNHNEYMNVGYYDIPPSGSAVFTLTNYIKYSSVAGAVTFNAASYNYASASFRAYTI